MLAKVSCSSALFLLVALMFNASSLDRTGGRLQVEHPPCQAKDSGSGVKCLCFHAVPAQPVRLRTRMGCRCAVCAHPARRHRVKTVTLVRSASRDDQTIAFARRTRPVCRCAKAK
jgi:hypothetical protein